MKRIKFYLDFDGTITQNDVVDMVLDRFADKKWLEVEKEWQAGKIGSRECLERQVRMLKMSPEELKKLCAEVKVDPFFTAFLKTTEKWGIPVTIVSDGFEVIIREVLQKHLADNPGSLKSIPIYSNNIEWTAKGPQAAFLSEDRCRHACANCKPEIIKNTAWADDTILFVGDGLSDRYAAQISSLTFAKGKLLQFCKDNELAYQEYENFGDVKQWLEKNYESLKSFYSIQPRIV